MNSLANRPISVDPMTVQSTGNIQPLILSGSGSPSPSRTANQVPINQPRKPITSAPGTPPVQLPEIACPIAPQIPATNRMMSNDSSVIIVPLFPRTISVIIAIPCSCADLGSMVTSTSSNQSSI